MRTLIRMNEMTSSERACLDLLQAEIDLKFDASKERDEFSTTLVVAAKKGSNSSPVIKGPPAEKLICYRCRKDGRITRKCPEKGRSAHQIGANPFLEEVLGYKYAITPA